MGVDKFWKVGGANVLCAMFFAKNNFYCPLFSCSPVIRQLSQQKTGGLQPPSPPIAYTHDNNHHPINFCNLGLVKSYEHAILLQ